MTPCLAAAALLATLVGGGLAGCVEAQRAPATPPVYVSLAEPGARVDPAVAQGMISSYRGARGLGPLALDPDLQRLAEAEADAMASADRPGRADALKARSAKAGRAIAGANLSAGYHTLAEAFSGWRDSPPHDAVMLERGAARMGIATAYAPGSKYKVYWALVVAR